MWLGRFIFTAIRVIGTGKGRASSPTIHLITPELSTYHPVFFFKVLVKHGHYCPLAVQYEFLAVPYNDFERHPRLVSC